MIKIKLICIGRIKEKYFKEACEEYINRLTPYCDFSLIELSPAYLPDTPSKAQIEAALEEEGNKIKSKISKSAAVFALCIEGKPFSSEELSAQVDKAAINGKSEVVFIVGGSFGLADFVKDSADIKLSMSKMTFPHQMARLILLEQIYRAFQISSGGKYHK